MRSNFSHFFANLSVNCTTSHVTRLSVSICICSLAILIMAGSISTAVISEYIKWSSIYFIYAHPPQPNTSILLILSCINPHNIHLFI